LTLKGQLTNSSGLLAKNPDKPTTSNILLNSKKLNIDDIISLSKQFIPKSDKKIDDRKNLHETLDAVYTQFHPSFNINVDALTYKDITINNLKTQIDLVNSKTIQLKNFDFNYLETKTNLEGSIIVPETESKLKDAIYINAKATSQGNITVFQKLFDIQLFKFVSGNYGFEGHVKGNVRHVRELLNSAQGDFTLLKTKLYYEPAKLDIDVDSLALFVDKSDMLLKKFNLEIGELYPLKLKGDIKNYPSFLIDKEQKKGAIFLKITAPFIDSNSWLTTVESLKDNNKRDKVKRNLYRLFKDINKFSPEIELAVDSIKYQDLTTKNVKALVYFENDSILKLRHLNLDYKQSTANIRGKVSAFTKQQDSLRKNPFDLDFVINAKGKSEDLNAYLKSKNFIFKSGDFEFNGHYKAQSENLNILNTKGYGDLKISRALVDYKAASLGIPVDSLHIEINDDTARLERLDIDLPGKSSVFFSGSIKHFSNFINNAIEDETRSSYFSIYSPYLNSADIKEFLAKSSSQQKKSSDSKFTIQKLKSALIGINSSFYPTVNVKIDTLKHNDLNLTEFGSNLSFTKQGDFKIKNTQLNFYGGSLTMNVDVGTNNEINIPINIAMQTNAINLNELATRFNYFNDEALRNTDNIEGNLNLNLDATGLLNNDGKLNINSLNGKIHINLSGLELYNYKPIMNKSFLMKDERFEKLTFRPIIQTFEIKNGVLIIPRTEIQSSAIHLFAEGEFKFDEYMNIWLALPWKNLKSKDGINLPEKTSYENAGAKFFLQMIQDKTEEKEKHRDIKVKVRLSNRKLRKMKRDKQ